MSRESDQIAQSAPSTRFLEWALLLCLLLHGLAMLSMVFLLLPGIPGGPNSDAVRLAYIVHHPWWWRLGWFPWCLAACSDVLLAMALLRSAWIPRLPARLTLLCTLAAIIPDQVGQVLWETRGVTLAQMGNGSLYFAFETPTFVTISAYGALLYTLTAMGWSWCFAAGGMWNRGLTRYSFLLWTLFIIVGVAPLLPQSNGAAVWISAGNAVGFVLLLVWFIVVCEQVLRRSQPDQPYGRSAPWHHPQTRLGLVLDVLGNSRFVRFVCHFIPVVSFLSAITDVVYVNYVVEASLLEPLVPPGLTLQRLGKDGRYALFTFLVYQHGHFGPRLLGPLRLLLPSPLQTNWRIYIRDPHTGYQGVYFVTNAITNTLYGLAARLLAEGMPMHVLRRGTISVDESGTVAFALDPGRGSAPDAKATFRFAQNSPVEGPWSVCFESYGDFLAYCIPQDRALSSQSWYEQVTRQEISLNIALEACRPLEGAVYSSTAHTLVGDAIPFCFYVAHVDFQLAKEAHDHYAIQ